MQHHLHCPCLHIQQSVKEIIREEWPLRISEMLVCQAVSLTLVVFEMQILPRGRVFHSCEWLFPQFKLLRLLCVAGVCEYVRLNM